MKHADDWWVERLQDDGSLSEEGTNSEYERGWIDCWNKCLEFTKNEIPFWEQINFYRDIFEV